MPKTTTTTTTTRKPKRVNLVPEIVDPELDYTIHESSTAAIRFSDPVVFSVPLIERPEAIGQRTHELAHLRFTPRKPSPGELATDRKISEHWLQVCEDARVNYLARQSGAVIDWLTDPAILSSCLDRMVEARDLPALTSIALARTNCVAEHAAITHHLTQSPIGRTALGIASKAYQQLLAYASGQYTIGASIHAARYVEYTLGAIEDTAAAMRDALKDTPADSLTDYDADPMDSIFDKSIVDGTLSSMVESGMMSEYTHSRGRWCEGWGKLTIAEPPRPTPCSVETRGKRRVRSDSGLVPNAMHRWCSDRYVFSTIATRDKGGSLLIDMSGSMALPYQTITKYLARFPLATVAVYSGESKTGTLTVLAKNGTRVERCPAMAGGNIVDGPALRWLSRQGKPRVWISDGQTTGVGDELYGYGECLMLCAAYGIKRMPRFANFLKSVGLLKPNASG